VLFLSLKGAEEVVVRRYMAAVILPYGAQWEAVVAAACVGVDGGTVGACRCLRFEPREDMQGSSRDQLCVDLAMWLRDDRTVLSEGDEV
jgi:hypothetical protein